MCNREGKEENLSSALIVIDFFQPIITDNQSLCESLPLSTEFKQMNVHLYCTLERATFSLSSSTSVASGLPTKVEAFTDVNSPLPAAVYLNSYPAPLNGVKSAIDAKSVHFF